MFVFIHNPAPKCVRKYTIFHYSNKYIYVLLTLDLWLFFIRSSVESTVNVLQSMRIMLVIILIHCNQHEIWTQLPKSSKLWYIRCDRKFQQISVLQCLFNCIGAYTFWMHITFGWEKEKTMYWNCFWNGWLWIMIADAVLLHFLLHISRTLFRAQINLINLHSVCITFFYLHAPKKT